MAWSTHERRRGREHPDVAGYVTSSSRDPNYCTNSISPSFPNICYEGIDHTLNRNASLVENTRQRRWMQIYRVMDGRRGQVATATAAVDPKQCGCALRRVILLGTSDRKFFVTKRSGQGSYHRRGQVRLSEQSQ